MKKIFLNFFMVAALLAPVALTTSCDKDDDNKVEEPVISGDVWEGNELKGSVAKAISLDASVEYQLTDQLIIQEGGELTIPAGTVIKASENGNDEANGFDKYILVLRGGKININGTASKPVVMTAENPNEQYPHWGGLVINGRAPISETKGAFEAGTEINDLYMYGGNDKQDNSGKISFLKLMHTGARNGNADKEHNALTLNAVGSGTSINDVYVYDCKDDGIEFFGGSVSVTNLLTVNTDDDMFDLTQGWSGKLENCYGIWEPGFVSTETDASGVEADGNLDGDNASSALQSNFTIKSMTINLRNGAVAGDNVQAQMNNVIKVRRGATATIENALVRGNGVVKSSGAVVDMTDGKGTGKEASKIDVTNLLMSNPTATKFGDGTFNNVKVEAGNTGCAQNVFSWTGYSIVED